MVTPRGHAAALRRLWTDKLSIVEYAKATDPGDGTTGFTEAAVLEGARCKLSFGSPAPALQGGEGAELTQAAKLFLDAGVDVKPGSKLIVERRGKAYEFSQSGLPAVYSRHQEIALEPFQGWA